MHRQIPQRQDQPRPRLTPRELARIGLIGLVQSLIAASPLTLAALSLPTGLVAAPSAALAAEEKPISLTTFKAHSRLKFNVDPGVEAEWKEIPGGFQLLFKGIGLVDLGAPLGAEEEWVKQFQGEKDPRLAGLEFKETPDGLVITGRWAFPTGDQAPADPRMEKFDYRDKAPAAYVVDFWPKTGPTVAEARAARVRAERAAALKRLDDEAKSRRDRRIAAEKARAERENATPFCSKPMDAHRDIFLEFYPVRERFDLGRWFRMTTPDSNFSYHDPEGTSQEAQYVRLALALYRQGNTGLAVKTLDFFEKEHPKSLYMPEMRFLRANALVKLGAEEEAIRILQDLIRTFGDSPVAIDAGLYVAKREMEKSQNLAALEHYLWLIHRHSTHHLSWVFHLGAAECLYSLRQTERAAKEYSWVMRNAPDRHSQAEAAIRQGDLYLSRAQYEQALAAYYQALTHYQKEAEEFPSIHINRAEALYWLGQHERARQEFAGFLERFPSHPAGWRATFRLGEIAGRAEGEAKARESREMFSATINKYPFSPGATLARVRLIPCGDRGGFAPEAAKRFFKAEASEFSGDGEVNMTRYRDFKGLAEMRFLMSIGGTDEALEVGLKELAANPRSEARLIMGNTLGELFRRSVLARLDEGKKYEALAFYDRWKDALPRRKDGEAPKGSSIAPDYLMRLSQAAADLGLGSRAQDLAEAHRQAVAEQGAGRALASEAPADDLLAKMQKAEQAWTRAQALWVSQGAAARAELEKLLAEVPEESEYSYEREVLLGLMDEKDRKPASALRHAVQAQLLIPRAGKPAEIAVERARIEAWAAGLQARAGDPRAAIDGYRRLEQALKAASPAQGEAAAGVHGDVTARLGLADPPAPMERVLALGELLARQSRWGEAAAAYHEAVAAKVGGNQVLYEYARALERVPGKESRKKARAALETIAESEHDDFWRRLARTQLADESGKYQSRKPAKEGGKP